MYLTTVALLPFQNAAGRDLKLGTFFFELGTSRTLLQVIASKYQIRPDQTKPNRTRPLRQVAHPIPLIYLIYPLPSYHNSKKKRRKEERRKEEKKKRGKKERGKRKGRKEDKKKNRPLPDTYLLYLPSAPARLIYTDIPIYLAPGTVDSRQ